MEDEQGRARRGRLPRGQLALGKNIRRFAQDSRLAGSHRARNDQQRFRKPSIAFDAFTASPKENSQTDPPREFARAAPRATSMQFVIKYPALASSMHFGLALRPLKAACIFAGSNAENT